MTLRAQLRQLAHRTATAAYGGLRAGRRRSGLRVLTYHAVGSAVDGDGEGLFSISPAKFAGHMRHLAAAHHAELRPLDATAAKAGQGIAVTFDDGYRDNLTVAAPLLAELGIPFTVFVTTGPVRAGGGNHLSPEELRELAAVTGVTIGAHSVSHVPLTGCDDAQLRAELGDSRHYLEDLLQRTVNTLAYPHGAVDRRVRDAAAEAGYVVAATTRFDVNAPGRDPLLLCRSDVWSGDDAATLGEKIAGDWDWYRWRRADPAASKG